MTHQPPHPPDPHWHQPTQIQPAAPKRAGWKLIGGITAGVLALCCGGITAIGLFADDPGADKATVTTAATAEKAPPAVPAPTTTVPPAPTATVPAEAPAGATPSRSPSPAASSSRPKRSVKPVRTTSKPVKPVPSKTKRKPKPRPTTQEPVEVSYENCTAVRDAGAAPIRRGDPGYGRHLDRDGDGVACE